MVNIRFVQFNQKQTAPSYKTFKIMLCPNKQKILSNIYIYNIYYILNVIYKKKHIPVQ